jgi:photosystem II stability/assembly factor-like uncharacterized protein
MIKKALFSIFLLLSVFVSVCINFIAVCASPASTSSIWSSLGPGGGGWITAISIDPQDANTVYVGSDLGGIFKSTDGGNTFVFINDGLKSYAIQDIAINPQSPNIVYLANTDGVYKSSNGGQNWSLKRNGFPPIGAQFSLSAPINALGIDSSNPNIVYAGVGFSWGNDRPPNPRYGSGNIYKSVDGGESWTMINTGTQKINSQATFFDIGAHPTNSQIVFATTNKGLYKSIDGGVNWQKKSTGIPYNHVRGLAIHPVNPNIVYITVWTAEGVEPWQGGVYRSTDGGETWIAKNKNLEKRNNGPGQRTSNFPQVYLDPNDPNVLYTGDWSWSVRGMYKSTDGGENWTPFDPSSADPVYLANFGVVSHIGLAASDANVVYFGSDRHVYRTTDGGKNWHSATTRQIGSNVWQTRGIETSDLKILVIDSDDTNIMYFGYGDNGLFKSTDGGATLEHLISPQVRGRPTDIFDIVLDPDNKGMVYVTYGETQRVRPSVLEESTDYGKTWSVLSGTGSGLPAGRQSSLVLDRTSPLASRTLYITVLGSGVYKSIDSGKTWLAVNNGLNNLSPSKLAIDPNNPQILYVGINSEVTGNIYKTTDGAKRWTQIAQIEAISDIAINPQDSNIIYVASRRTRNQQGGIHRSTDGGLTWTKVLNERWIISIAIRPDNPNIVYAGSFEHPFFDQYVGKGLYKSTDGGTTWDLTNNGLPHTNIRSITFDPKNPQILYIGTSGGGMFRGTDSPGVIPQPSGFGIIPKATTITEGGILELTIELRDAAGGPTTSLSDVTVNLTSSTQTGVFDTAQNGPFDGTVTSVTIPAGKTSATAFYKDTAAGTVTLTVSAPGLTSATQVVTVKSAPMANAGTNQSVMDTDGDGVESVTLDGSKSTAPNGSIRHYSWTENGKVIATGVNPTVNLTVGTHTLTLTVTDDEGAVASDTVQITVTGLVASPTITTQPTNQNVTVGQTAAFRVASTGTAPLSYQWQKNGVNIPGATSATYTTPPMSLSDNGAKFRVIVTNTAGSTTSDEAILTVVASPIQTVLFSSGFESGVQVDPPVAQDGQWWQSISGADASGSNWTTALPELKDPLTQKSLSKFQYLVPSNRALTDYVATRIDSVIGSSGTPTKALYMEVKRFDKQNFRVFDNAVRNQYNLSLDGNLEQAYVRYWMKLQPDLETTMPKEVSAWRNIMEWWEANNDYRWSIDIVRPPRGETFFWEVKGEQIQPDQITDWNVFNENVKVPVGKWFLLEVFWKHSTGPDGRVWVAVDGTTIVDYKGNNKKGSPFTKWHLFKVYTDTHLFNIGPAYQWIDDVEIHPDFPVASPTITTQPANQSVAVGQTTPFRVVSTGTAPLSYQWQKNGVNIPGATSSTYTTPPVSLSDNGAKFRVIVTNAAGNTTSNEATLTVTKVEFDLLVPKGIGLIHIPLKVTDINEQATQISTISELYDVLGGTNNVNFIITYQPAEGPTRGRWYVYLGDTSRGTSADRELTDELGMITMVKQPVTLYLKGDALGTDGRSQIRLQQGLNLVGVPLRDERIKQVSDLLTLEGTNNIIDAITILDHEEFKVVARAGDTGEFPITGGQSFIITARAPGVAEITGVAWENVSGGPTAAPPTMLSTHKVHESTPILAVHGVITDDVTGLGSDGFRVTVKNLSTGATLETLSGSDIPEGGYSLAFVDTTSSRAAQAGALLEITAQAPEPFIAVHPLRYTVSTDDVSSNQIHLPNLIAYQIPTETKLLSNYPNPFNPETWIPYRLAEDAKVTLTVYDITGMVVRTLSVGHQSAGVYESKDRAIYWDGRNDFGERVASGIYFYNLKANTFAETRRMLVLK